VIQRVRYLINLRGFTNKYIKEQTGLGATTVSTLKGDGPYDIKSIEIVKFLFREFDGLNGKWLFEGIGPKFFKEENRKNIDYEKRIKKLEKDFSNIKHQLSEITNDLKDVDLEVMVKLLQNMIIKEKEWKRNNDNKS